MLNLLLEPLISVPGSAIESPGYWSWRTVAPRVVYSLLTLYMLAILLRWVGPWLEFDVESGRWRWIARITDPLINLLRRKMPRLGPMDFAPVVALLLAWVLREVLVQMLIRS